MSREFTCCGLYLGGFHLKGRNCLLLLPKHVQEGLRLSRVAMRQKGCREAVLDTRARGLTSQRRELPGRSGVPVDSELATLPFRSHLRPLFAGPEQVCDFHHPEWASGSPGCCPFLLLPVPSSHDTHQTMSCSRQELSPRSLIGPYPMVDVAVSTETSFLHRQSEWLPRVPRVLCGPMP